MARHVGNQPDRPTSREIRHLADLLFFIKPYRWHVLGGTLALLVTASTVLALGNGMRYLIDRGFGLGDPQILDQTLGALFAVTVVLAIATYTRFYFVTWIGERVVADIRKAVFNHIINLSPGFFEVTRTGEVISRLTTDTTLLQTVVGSSASIALRNTIMMIGAAVMLFITSPKLAGIVFLVVPFVVVPIIIYGRRVRAFSRLSQDKIADVSADASESLYGIRTVQAFAHEYEDQKRFSVRIEESLSAAHARIRARALLTALVILLVFGAIAIVLWIGGGDVLAGNISAGQLSAFVFYAIVVASALGAITEVIGDLQRAAGAMERIIELLNTQPTIKSPSLPKHLPQPSIGHIKFNNVTFHYPSRPEQKALDNFTLEIQPGETIALVGPSGAGKTTVIQLLMRFYDPDQGNITFDGIDIREVTPATLRRVMGLVPQDPVIFSSSAAENILYGRPDADMSAIRAAADAAHASEFLDRLPQSFDTHLGERGVRLSGGQRQRIAIARAVLRNPALLLLDEATSALDAESEQMVQTALDRLMVGRTTLVIAHRLATILKANRIVVLDKGRIDAIGTHAELIRQGGLYARLAELQFDQPGNTAPEVAA